MQKTDTRGGTVQGGQGSGKISLCNGNARIENGTLPRLDFSGTQPPPESPRKPAETKEAKEINIKSKENKGNTHKNYRKERGSRGGQATNKWGTRT